MPLGMDELGCPLWGGRAPTMVVRGESFPWSLRSERFFEDIVVLRGPSFASCDDDTEIGAVLVNRLRTSSDP